MNERQKAEPFGHLAPETKLERYWSQKLGLVQLLRRRKIRFDPHACATYASMAYDTAPFTLPSDLPDDDWINDAFKGFVRTEFSERRVSMPLPKFAEFSCEEAEVPEGFLHALTRRVDDEVQEISSSLLKGSDAGNPTVMAQQIYNLICHPSVGTRQNQTNIPEADFVKKVAAKIEAQERLLFVLLGFPFKDQNPFRVTSSADQPDLGEIAFLLRLYRVTQAVYQVHPFGLDIVVLTDGEIYADIFGVDRADAVSYLVKMKYYRSQLNLQGAVSFIPLSDLFDRARGDHASQHTVISYIGDNIERRLLSDSSMQDLYQVLVSAIKWNSNTRQQLLSTSRETAWDLLTLPRASIAEEFIDAWDTIHSKASKAAIGYAAINLTLRWLDLVQKFFPDAIRCTMHAKVGQVCLARANNTFPWNGVAWSEEWPTSIDDFEVKPAHSLGELGSVRKVTVRTLGYPCFYSRATVGSNVQAARRALPSTGWEFDGIEGRSFTPDDAEALTKLGSNDPAFSWERLIRDEVYYNKIVQFRIEHYRRYGFGVQGIWCGRELIGQCGLQVLNETRDQVELVIFLGANYVDRGIGLKLSRYAISRCTESGMKALYGVARAENTAAVGLLRRLQAKSMKTQVHFGYLATIYSIPLKRS